jgi:hypothetical protein
MIKANDDGELIPKFFGLQHPCLHGNLLFIDLFHDFFTTREVAIRSTCVESRFPCCSTPLRAAVGRFVPNVRTCISKKGLPGGKGVTPSEAKDCDGAHDGREAIGLPASARRGGYAHWH